MDTSVLERYGRRIEYLLEANVPLQAQECIDQAVAGEDWELLALLSLTASEISARRMVDALLEAERYDELAFVACLRRQVRRQQADAPSGGMARRVFRDFEETDENAAGIPDYIRDDVKEMRVAAERSRAAALRRDADQDRDAIREHIVENLGERLPTSEGALEALVLVAKAAGWESARRRAAMKVANHEPSLKKLVAGGRWSDLIALGRGASLHSVSGNISTALAERLDDLAKAGEEAALKFVAEYHPDRGGKRAAQQALQSIE
ncbi:MAG: hypothetical protein ACE5JM_02230 [Armatimonadota bacterium]